MHAAWRKETFACPAPPASWLTRPKDKVVTGNLRVLRAHKARCWFTGGLLQSDIRHCHIYLKHSSIHIYGTGPSPSLGLRCYGRKNDTVGGGGQLPGLV